MALLDDILAWSQSSLKPWQQDAVRRLFQKTLDTGALDDLYAMLKDSVGIVDPAKRKPDPLDKHHLPASAAKAASVTLLSLRDVKNVNRLAPAQILKFSPKGITVIYGGNGSGKSGYARVLKRACRARDLSEDIRPNALDKLATNAIPQATFETELGGQSATVAWQKDKPSPVELATVAVFDTHCARAYLDQQQEIAYLPFGLDVVENLAQVVLPRISDKLIAEIAATSTDTVAFNHLLGATKVGKLISSLSEKTNIDEVKALALLTKDDVTRLSELEKTLTESDPKAKAKELKLSAARISTLKIKIETVFAWVKDDSIQKLKSIDDQAEEAIAAETSAAIVLRSGDTLLPGTGDPIWKALFQSAKAFSKELAYPGHDFPYIHEESQCVLCQQSLSQDAKDRFNRFDSYIQADIAKTASDKRNLRESAVNKIQNVSLTLDMESELIEELTSLDPVIVSEINNFEAAIQARQSWLLAAQKNHIWDVAPALTVDPCIRLQTISEKLFESAKGYEKATDDGQRLLLKNELAELNARDSLSTLEQALIDLIARMKTKSLLTKCKEELKTKPISDKAKDFASSTVTAPLRSALKEEFEILGVSTMMPRLDESVEKGKMKHKLELDLVHQAQIRDILSEGEQRAIAIGSFLAELRTGGHGGGIVFDDPVSSLDHFRRQKVASRLVDEAKVRQVIIFTHDTSFLGELRDMIEQIKVDHIIHYLEWEGSYSGRIVDGLPWHHQSFKERIDKLQQEQAKLIKIWPTYPSDTESAAMRSQYSLMRATVERVIQDVVFNGVVVRYRDWIKVGNLSSVVGFASAECNEIERIYKKCCEVIDAHDPASGKNAPIPSAIDLGNDIAALVQIVEMIKIRRTQNK